MKTANESILIFCENVKLIREKNNLSQKDMANIMGIGVPSLKKLERGCIPNRVGVSALLKLATYCHMKPHEFFARMG